MKKKISLQSLSDNQLLERLTVLVAQSRTVTSEVVLHLVEVEDRRLHLALGFPSLFAYCVEVLHFSEQETYDRILVARLTRRFPVLFDLLADGSLHLTAVRLLAPHLTADNHEDLVAAAKHKSKRQIELLLAERFPRPAVPAEIRKLPERRPSPPLWVAPTELPPAPAPPATPARRPVVSALSAAEYKIQFTASARLHEKLLQARDGLRHCVPNGDPAAIFERALDALLEKLAREKKGAVKSPRPPRETGKRSRLVPAQVRREVYARDGEQCSFVSADGRRCSEKGWLELDHIRPYGKGGSTVTGSVRVLCRMHNQFEAERAYGRERMERARGEPPARDLAPCESS
jgi:hypothetical protein